MSIDELIGSLMTQQNRISPYLEGMFASFLIFIMNARLLPFSKPQGLTGANN